VIAGICNQAADTKRLRSDAMRCDGMCKEAQKLAQQNMLGLPYVWPPPSANMCMGDGTFLLLAGNSNQRCHQCANILDPTGQIPR
jgi:hypothetical protein